MKFNKKHLATIFFSKFCYLKVITNYTNILLVALVIDSQEKKHIICKT